ncbi:MAG: ABC transporter permease subunit [Parasporobacterium sp.]|nr:ABC transporter permease subunit [Parasporobacterium sp.]
MQKKLTPYLLLLPQIVLGGTFILGLGTGILQSLGINPVFGLTTPTLKYYIEVLTRPAMFASVKYSLNIAFVSAFLATVLGTLICMLMVNRKRTGGAMVRVVQLPIIVPHVVVALFVVNIFSQNGILARVCAALGMISDQQQFPMFIYDQYGIGVILAYLWKELPFIVYFVLALMANINGSLGEAAVNLGASRWKSFTKVTLPLCMNTILSGFMIIFVFALGAYELPFLLGATTPKAMPILAYQKYSSPELLDRPYAMAINGIIVVISLIVAVAYYILIRKASRNLGDHKE